MPITAPPIPMQRASAGFTLMEALIAAAVLGFGLFAIARLQVMLIGDSDLAKQRTEAAQLAEKKIEELRSFSQLAPATGKFAYQDIVNGSDSVDGSSAVYARAWTVTDVAAGIGFPTIYKNVAMQVTWQARTGVQEAVGLNSVIALADPAVEGLGSVPPSGTPTRTPRGRNINIPWPAVKLGGDLSGFTPPGAPSGTAIIFNDKTGAVTSTCTSATLPTSDNTSGTPTSTAGWNCTAASGFLLAGFIPVPPYQKKAGKDTDVPDQNAPATTSPLNFHIAVTVTPNSSPQSGTADSVVDCFDDVLPAGNGTLFYPGYVSYACVIKLGTATAWSGTTSFLPAAPTVNWGTGAGQWFVCRYVPGKPVATYPYQNVTKSLENQNYALIQGAAGASCPAVSIVSVPPTTLVQHQPPP